MAVKIAGTGPTALRTITWPDYDAHALTSATAVLPYVIGDLLYASSTSSLAKLAGGAAAATGAVLVNGATPSWSPYFTVSVAGCTSLVVHTVTAAAGALLSLDNSAADAGVANAAYISFQTAGTSRWYLGMSAAGGTGNFDLYDNIDGYNAVSVLKGSGILSCLKGLNIQIGGSTSISTGVGSVKMTTANAATNAAWIPINYAGTTYYVPGYTTHAP